MTQTRFAGVGSLLGSVTRLLLAVLVQGATPRHLDLGE